jgi:hypothetical protein
MTPIKPLQTDRGAKRLARTSAASRPLVAGRLSVLVLTQGQEGLGGVLPQQLLHHVAEVPAWKGGAGAVAAPPFLSSNMSMRSGRTLQLRQHSTWLSCSLKESLSPSWRRRSQVAARHLGRPQQLRHVLLGLLLAGPSVPSVGDAHPHLEALGPAGGGAHHCSELLIDILLQIVIQLVAVLGPVDLLDIVERVGVPPGEEADDVIDSGKKPLNCIAVRTFPSRTVKYPLRCDGE